MKKNLLVLIAFIFSVTIKAQAPALTYTNVTGSNSITCGHPNINYIASVSNYTNGLLTYTWVSLSGTASGTNVSFSNPNSYTVTAFNTANSFSLSQVFSIGINTTIPTSTVSPVVQNITCPVGSPATFTGTAVSPTVNVTHSWLSPFSSGIATNGGTVSLYTSSAPGSYTYCVTDNINGCSTCKTVTITSVSGFPTFSVVSPQQFTIGCGSASLTSITITNVNTNPTPGGPVSYTILPPTYTGPTYTLGGAATYTANLPGQYTVVVHDNTSSCEAIVPVSIISNTAAPNISSGASTQTLSCYTPSIILTGSSTNASVSYTWSFPGPGQVTTNTVAVLTTSNTTSTVIATYTLSIKDNTNMCSSTQTVTLYQNTSHPSATITGTNVISCQTSSITLTNSSISNVPPAFSPTQPVMALSWNGPVPQASVSNVSSYLAYTPGAYTLVVQDLNNGCTSIATKTIADNRIYPALTSPPPFDINCPAPTATIYPIITGPTTGFTYSWTPPASASVSALNQPSLMVNAPGIYTITVTNPVVGCSTTTLISVAVCAGIKQNASKNDQIHIFPNPNNGLFTINITSSTSDGEIEIYTILGSKIKAQKITSEKNIIDIQDQPKGIYFIYVTENNKSVGIFKIVKQ